MFGVIWRARLHFKKVDALLRLRIVALLRRVQTIELCLLSEAYERKLEREREREKRKRIFIFTLYNKRNTDLNIFNSLVEWIINVSFSRVGIESRSIVLVQ